jgi:hypothetical protein
VDRLYSFEQPKPATIVPVLVGDDDFIPAATALRGARFNPARARMIGTPPPDALELTTHIGVDEPAAWPQSQSDEDRIRRIAAVFERAEMRARIATTDIWPGARVERQRTGHGRNIAAAAEEA